MSDINVSYAVELEGADKLVEKLNRIGYFLRGQVAKEAVDAGAKHVQNHARLNIRTTFSRHQTGGLSNSIGTTSRIVGNGGEAEITVSKVYARIQELGGTIRPLPTNKSGFLWWRDPDSGQLRKARQVTLPPRPYLRPAMTDHQSDILGAMGNVIDKYLQTERE